MLVDIFAEDIHGDGAMGIIARMMEVIAGRGSAQTVKGLGLRLHDAWQRCCL